MLVMRPRLLVVAVAAIALPAAALPAFAARPEVCQKSQIRGILKDNGKATSAGISHVECADVTGDGTSDAVFTVAGGGDRGSTHFGVMEGPASSLLLYRRGDHVSIDAVDDHRFDVQQPVYEEGDGAPASFFWRPYRFNGSSFVVGKVHRYPNPKARFKG